ncbi:class I SAM-dependent methyltransferase [Haladaptatus sp. DFWS20]|uniref:class I SAM-dependent methyltransferase n=1 Tax=Haladaptatus sp. DFWS20 TaxID=3403467 RepID=UPI003EBD67EF
MNVPQTITTALADRPVTGAVCLEAGAGFGNMTAGLLAAGASRVYTVTNNSKHANAVYERINRDEAERTAVLEADLCSLPIVTDSVEIITAHGLFNVLEPASLESVTTELTRVAAPGCHLIIDDYTPPPDDAAVRELFALENAATELATGRPALTFYPEAILRRLFIGYGWEFDREQILLEPVPWTASHIEAHTSATLSMSSRLPNELGECLTTEVECIATVIGEESAGKMYSVALQLPA